MNKNIFLNISEKFQFIFTKHNRIILMQNSLVAKNLQSGDTLKTGKRFLKTFRAGSNTSDYSKLTIDFHAGDRG